MKKSILLSVFMCFSVLQIWAQSWTTYTTSEGLQDNSISSITIDQEQNVWVTNSSSSIKGVTKFNGTTWSFIDLNAKGIIYNPYLSSFCNKDGKVLFGSGYSPVLYDPNADAFTAVTSSVYPSLYDPYINNSSHAYVGITTYQYAITQDSRGNFWIASSPQTGAGGFAMFDGVNIYGYNPNNYQVTPSSAFRSIAVDPHNDNLI